MNFGFAAPEWLFLIPALVALCWRVKALRLGEPLRTGLLSLLLLALCDPQLRGALARLNIELCSFQQLSTLQPGLAREAV